MSGLLTCTWFSSSWYESGWPYRTQLALKSSSQGADNSKLGALRFAGSMLRLISLGLCRSTSDLTSIRSRRRCDVTSQSWTVKHINDWRKPSDSFFMDGASLEKRKLAWDYCYCDWTVISVWISFSNNRGCYYLLIAFLNGSKILWLAAKLECYRCSAVLWGSYHKYFGGIILHVAFYGVVPCYIVHKHISGTWVFSLCITAEAFTLWTKVWMAGSGKTILS